MDFTYIFAFSVPIVLVYLNLRREKSKRKTETNPMNEARIFESYVIIGLLVLSMLYFTFK